MFDAISPNSSNGSSLRTRRDSVTLLRNTRTTDSPIVAKSAEFLFRLGPRSAACALVTIRRGGKKEKTQARKSTARAATAGCDRRSVVSSGDYDRLKSMYED